MLPARARLRKSPDFAEALRFGRRTGRPTLVASVLRTSGVDARTAVEPPRIGFVVGRRIGGAVVRNRLRRRLRHLVADYLADDRLERLSAGSRTVVRALPGAERLSYRDLGRELDAVLGRASR
jgi:ribonuclease P protein component